MFIYFILSFLCYFPNGISQCLYKVRTRSIQCMLHNLWPPALDREIRNEIPLYEIFTKLQYVRKPPLLSYLDLLSMFVKISICCVHFKYMAWNSLTLAVRNLFCKHGLYVGGGLVGRDPLAISPLIELQLRDKNQRVQRVETERLAYLFNILGHLVTSELRSMTPNAVFSSRSSMLW